MPIGLTEMYFRAQMPRLFEAISRPSSQRPPKRIEVLASWGAVYPMLTSRIRSRRLLSDFCVHHNESAGVVRCLQVPLDRWFETLATARFLLSPKWLEAMLVGVIPICQNEPAFEQLAAAGWPMVVVRDWSEVLDAGARQRWWSQHAPRLEALTAAGGLRVEGYWKYLFRGLDSGVPPSVVF
mmetsp:Transcript_10797/g.34614  ORF Transcript_10797/g.34614 Transcript_10797/m.34614 type:complete len:182 (+) Transcript_10797:572-1117(+)